MSFAKREGIINGLEGNINTSFSTNTVKNGYRNKSNQDRSLTMNLPNGGTLFLILDGHGDLGHVYAEIVKFFAEFFFETNDEINHDTIKLFFQEAHKLLKDSLHNICSDYLNLMHKYKYTITDGEIINEKGKVINSGTTCSLVILTCEGDLFVSNVGDSSVFLYSPNPITGLSIERIDSATGEIITNQLSHFESETNGILELTTDTPLNSFYERNRIISKATKCGEKPLYLVYDGISHTPIFHKNKKVPLPSDCYRKNVRGDIAFYAITPDEFTISVSRSIGDFIIEKHGGTYMPVITHIKNFKSFVDSNNDISLICATDGVWDSWRYEDIYSFIYDLKSKKTNTVEQISEKLSFENTKITKKASTYDDKTSKLNLNKLAQKPTFTKPNF
jgi:serine/threonine protein phosphatase PrpC